MTRRKLGEPKTCVICGATFVHHTLRGNAKTCGPDCAREKNRRSCRENKRKRAELGIEAPTLEDGVITILHDPTPDHEGGFVAGSRIPLQQFNLTLGFGYFSAGTIVRKMRREYRVQGKHLLPIS